MSTMSTKKVLVDLLQNEGVEYVFGIPGATEIQFMDALEGAPDIQYILGLNEIVCAGMAEGYARATGKPGFLNLHTGPGTAASLGMICNAQAGGVPLVITVGQQHSRLLQRDPHLSGDIVGMGKVFTKWCTEIVHGEDLPVTIQRAFKMAMQPPTGPVLVSIPQDVLQQDIEYAHKPTTRVYPRMRPDGTAVDLAVKMIEAAKRPVVYVESGVARSAALDEVVRFAELIGARVYHNWMSDVNFPVNHPQYLGDLDPNSPPAGPVFKDVDLLIGIGCPMFGQGFYNTQKTIPNQIKIIHIDDDPWEIGKNFSVDCGIQGDVKASLTELNSTIEKRMPPEFLTKAKARADEIAAEKTKINDQLEQQIEAEWDHSPISISRLMTEIKKVVTPDTVIVDDCWSSSGMLRQILDLTEHNSFFRARKGGSIGWGLPGALGVKLGFPDKKVIAVSGDGSASWSMQSLWTAARYKIPVTFVITNNAVYRQVKMVRRIVLGDYPLNEKHLGMELDKPVINFSLLAESMGVKGERVERPEDLNHVLNTAMDSEEPRLVEVFVENRSS